PRNRQRVCAKGNRYWGGHDDRWIGPEYQSHRKRLVRSFVALEIEMSVRGRKDAEGLAVMDLVTIETHVARFGDRVLGHVTRQRKIGPAIQLVPDRRRKLGQIDVLTDHHVLLTRSALDKHRRERLGGAPVPFRRQLIRFDTER